MKPTLLLILVLVLTMVSPAVGAVQGYQDIDTAGVRRLLDAGDAEVIFPLSPIEFSDLHIKGSVNIPMEQLADKLPDDKNRKLVFYCLGIKCVASWRAAEVAVELGYRQVYAYREGLPAWVAAGYPTESFAKLPEVEVDQISTLELSQLLGSNDIVLLDINLREDAHKFHIDHPKRVHIPLDELDASLAQLPRNKQLVVICLKGKRSPTACRYLKGQGYQKVAMVDGGVQKWILEGRPVVKEE